MSQTTIQERMDCSEPTANATLDAIKSMKDEIMRELRTTRSEVAGLTSKVDEYMGRVTKVESRCSTIEQKIHQQDTINKTMSETIVKTREDLTSELQDTKEKLARVSKACNIIIKGIGEKDDAILSSLIEIILPKREDIPRHVRIGEATKNSRHIKMFLASAYEKNAALRNCKYLKDRTEFSGISVQPDLTLKQQEERRKKHIQTRSEAKQKQKDETAESQNPTVNTSPSVPATDSTTTINDEKRKEPDTETEGTEPPSKKPKNDNNSA